MICPHCKNEIPNPVSQAGGKKSKRKITPEEQAKMQEARKAAFERKKNLS